MIEKRDKESGDAILDKDNKKTYYLKVDKNVDIRINGVKVPAGAYFNVKRPYDYDYREMYISKKITEEEYLEKKAVYEGKGEKSYFQFEFEFVSEEK